MVSCELEADFGNSGNDFKATVFNIVNDDSREVESWTITLDFVSGNINGSVGDVFADPQKQQKLASVSRNGLVLTISSEDPIPPMTTLPIYGLELATAGVNNVPTCELEVKGEGFNGGGGNNSGGGFANVTQEELDAYFVDYPCGVGYTAIGNGGWPMCFRTEDGQAACKSGGGTDVNIINWNDQTPVDNVMQVTGMGPDRFIMVTGDGAAYAGKIDTGLDPENDKVVDTGAITASGGFKPRGCIMVDAGDKRDVLCTYQNNPWERPELPEDFDAVQLSSTYSFDCALNRKGEVWCWGDTPQKFDNIWDGGKPVQMPFDAPLINLSADQTTICGISYFGGPKCLYSSSDPRYMPIGPNLQGEQSVVTLPEDFEPNAVLFHGAYSKGIIVRQDGSAVYSTGNGTTPLNIPDIIAGGGKRQSVSVLTASGDVYAVDGGNAQLIDSHKAQNPVCPR